MSLTLAEARARAAALTVTSYDVHLDLTRTDSFRSTSRIRFEAGPPSQERSDWRFVDLADARALEVRLDGADVPVVGYDERRILLPALDGAHELVVEAELPYVTTGDGMHTFTDPEDGERYVSAYCGMDMASRIFACFDQPDLKAPITLTVDAPDGWTVLANGTGGQHRRADGDRWTFTTTPRISTYLFVVCAGPWASVRFEHAGLPFGWHGRASRRAQIERDAAELVEITRRCFDHYVGVFDEPYVFDSYDQMLVPGLNWGAMETPGCITFREELVPPDPATDDERLERAMVIAHEMAHMWFGDLATMRWWDDSWLNESFADFMGYRVAARAAGYDGAWVGWALDRKPTAYVADARRSTHPIAADTETVVDVDTALGNFDMITYAKGNAVLRQLVTWLGDDDFLRGVNAYLSRYAFANATLADFLDALAGATARDVRGWAEKWLRTTGFDTIRVERDGDVPVLHRDGTRPHRFRVTAYDDQGSTVGHRTIDLGDQPVTLPEYAGHAIVPNSHDEAYAALDMDDRSWAVVSSHLADLDDPLTRAVLWSTAIDRVRAGRGSVHELLALAGRHLPDEPDPLIVEKVLVRLAAPVLRHWTRADLLERAESELASLARTLLDRPGSTQPAARLLAHTSTDAAELVGWLDTGRCGPGREVVTDVRWTALARLASLGEPVADRIDAELGRDRSETGRLSALRARAAVPTEAAKEDAWRLLVAEDTSNRDYEFLAEGFWDAAHPDLLRPWLPRYLEVSPAQAVARGPAFSRVIGGRAFPLVPWPDADLVALRAGLADRLAADDLPTVLQRSWNDRLDDLDVALRVREL